MSTPPDKSPGIRPAAAPRPITGRPVAAKPVSGRPVAGSPVTASSTSPAQAVPAPPASTAAATSSGAAGAVGFLDNIAIFQPLPPQLKQQLAAQLTKKELKSGEVLFTAGDVGDAMYVVTSGAVSVYVADQNLGLTHELAKLCAGQALGEMALVTGEPRSASVRAIEDSQLLTLSRDIFYRLVSAAPQVALTIAGVLAKRLEQKNKGQGIEFGSLRDMPFDPALLELVPLQLIKRHRIVPVKIEGGVATLATADPGNRLGLDDMRRMLRGMDIKLLAVAEADFEQFVKKHLDAATLQRAPTTVARQTNYMVSGKKIVYHGASGADREDESRLRQVASGQDVVDMLNAIIAEGIDRGASDIHIEPERNQVVVRYRVDGRLAFRDGTLPSSLHLPLMSRLKVLAGLDISERRLPQDGRISLDMEIRSYDMRMATLATKYGEKATLRLLDSSALSQDLNSLILAEKVSQVVRQLFHRPNGLIIVSGPTGSGKTTTLYGALKQRQNPELAIYTVEDPIEYDVPGITQVQVNEAVGLGFAEVMRTFLRQDPDIIFVGETRDAATAKLACNAAMTGHLVLTSLHTNDAVSAVLRLRDMQVEPFVLSGALLGVINQRLVRRVCPACRTEHDFGDIVRQNLAKVGVVVDPSTALYKGSGCESCSGAGFKGRIGVFELLVTTAAVREAIGRDADAQGLREAAQQGSYVSLANYCSFLLGQGLVVPSEVLRIMHQE